MTIIEQRAMDSLSALPRALREINATLQEIAKSQKAASCEVPRDGAYPTKFYVTLGMDHPWHDYVGVIYANTDDHAREAANKVFGRGKWCSVQEARPCFGKAELPPIFGWEFGDLDWEMCRVYE